MKVLVFDLETSVKSPIGFKASPYWNENQIVAACAVTLNEELETDKTLLSHVSSPMFKDMLADLLSHLETADLVVGHNIQFDLAYLLKHDPNLYQPDLRVWDTKIVQHLLQGHSGATTLDDVAKAYGFVGKTLEVSKFWQDGYETEDIPLGDLLDYVHSDVNITKNVFLKQLELVDRLHLNTSVLRRNASRVATAAIQAEGMQVSMDRMNYLQEVYETRRAMTEDSWHETVKHLLEGEADPKALEAMTFKPSSVQDVSTILCGGDKKFIVDEIVMAEDGSGPVLYKSGKRKDQVKTKKAEHTHTFKGAIDSTVGVPDNFGDDVLEAIALAHPGTHVADFCKHTREYRAMAKNIGTYLAGTRKLVFPDSRVHPAYHHHVTRTGRLSCSGPNLQNVTESEIKSIYHPRDKDTLFFELDFNQLELRCVAVLSKDAQMLQDIRDEVDIHRQLASVLFDKEIHLVTPQERRLAKRGTFQLLYGAGAPSIAKQWKMPVDAATKFVNAFFDRYPGILKWRLETMEAVNKEIRRTPVVPSVFGTPYRYEVERGEAKFTQVINYPVQGLAAEIVHITLDILYRLTHHNRWKETVKLVNCVHDSFLFEVKGYAFDSFREEIHAIIASLPKEVSKQLDINFSLPLTYTTKVGLDWYNTEEM